MSKFVGFDKIVHTGSISQDAMQVVLQAEAKHNQTRDQIETVLSQSECDIHLGDIVLTAGSERHKGFLAGLAVSLNIIGKFPLAINECDEEGDDDE